MKYLQRSLDGDMASRAALGGHVCICQGCKDSNTVYPIRIGATSIPEVLVNLHTILRLKLNL